MKKINIKTETYDLGDDFFVDIVDTGKTYDSYIYRTNLGFKDFIFGVDKSSCSHSEYLAMLNRNVDEYIEDFAEQYC